MIITKLIGGLGNQMFQYAAGLAVAKKTGGILKIDPYYLFDKSKRSFRFCHRDYGLDIFQITALTATPGEILHFTMPHVMNKYVYHMLNRLYPQRHIYAEDQQPFADIPQDAYMTGYWQKAEILKYADAEIRNEFRMRNELIDPCEEIKQMILKSKNPVCVSFRRGDYVGHPTLGFLTLDWYHNAINTLHKMDTSPKQYFVFSDDIPWCEENFKPQINSDDTLCFVNQKFTGKKYQTYFYLMMLCRYFIIPNSTYPFGAAHLSTTPDKKIIAPAVWFKGQTVNRNTILPEDWIAL